MELNQDLSYEINNEETSGSWKTKLWLQRGYLVTDQTALMCSFPAAGFRKMWGDETWRNIQISLPVFSLGSEAHTGFRRRQVQCLPMCCCHILVFLVPHYLIIYYLTPTLWGHFEIIEQRPGRLHNVPKFCHASKPKLLVYYKVALDILIFLIFLILYFLYFLYF